MDFDIKPDVMVVTSKYVMKESNPVLEVSHEYDKDEGIIWQFHCGNGRYDVNDMMLVRLSTVISLDETLKQVADLPIGSMAKRETKESPWVYQNE